MGGSEGAVGGIAVAGRFAGITDEETPAELVGGMTVRKDGWKV
jgi:hypothetical protein